MSESWLPLPLDQPLFANLEEGAVVNFQTAIENGFINELGGHTRFPGLTEFADLSGKGRVYLHDFEGDLIAVSDGQTFRIDRNATATNVTAVPVEGGRRVIFAKTDRDLLMAAGGPIVRLRDRVTEVLSAAAPLATHVAFIDSFTLAVEINSGHFFNSGAGAEDAWDPLDIFAANGNGSNIKSMIVTPTMDVMLGTERSVEQFERMPTGATPFYRKWTIGAGTKLPYASVFADNAAWAINMRSELVRFVGQTAIPVSDPIARVLAKVDDWTDTWIGGYPDQPLHTVGQRFLLLQIPNATNAYGTKGITFVFDLRAKRFSSLYGWDDAAGRPARWPGWSYWMLWDRVFVGGEGKIYELTNAAHSHAGGLARWLVRTSHIAGGNALQVKNFRLQVRRGIGGSASAPDIRVRCSRDGKPFGPWVARSLGKAGDTIQFIEFSNFGTGTTFMFEIACTQDTPVDLIKAEVKTDPIGH